jgi:hypothetical protein
MATEGRSRVTKTYGRGSLLGLLSPILSFVMARSGMNGWERSGRVDMERDGLAMEGRGYRVASADEYRLPFLGITWFEVSYELDEERPAAR